VNIESLQQTMIEVVNRWPSAGLAVAIVRDGTLEAFISQGVADVDREAPITADTVFRVGSITKTFTAVAVMQLWEEGAVDLDAPADHYLRTFRLVPAAGVTMPTLRHLLTHTAGIGYWRRLSDVLRPGLGSGDVARGRVQPLAEYYRYGLPVEVEPGTKWMYSNHGIAVVGQIVEDVTGEPIERYLRDRVLEPLAMDHTDLTCSERVRDALATGYALKAKGLQPVAHREVATPAAGGLYSTPADLARYVGALLNGGIGERGAVLKPETVADMFQPHYLPDPRLPGMGLTFMLDDAGGHRTAGHSGVLSGFLSAISLAPDDGFGVVVLSNTGTLMGRGAPEPLAGALLRRLLAVPDDPVRHDVPQHPDVWGELRGWYGMDPGPVTNLFFRLVMGAGVEVKLRRDHLLLQPLTPLPPMRDGFRLFPDDPNDPYAFRVDYSPMGLGDLRAVFTTDTRTDRPRRLLMDGMAFEKRHPARNPRLWTRGATAGAVMALAIRRARQRSASKHHPLVHKRSRSSRSSRCWPSDAVDGANVSLHKGMRGLPGG
jgi:CubicO group peptidase (beta-lactamase class C family)